MTVGSLGNPYFLALVDGATKQAHAINPSAQVSAVSSDYDLGKQFNQMDNFIANAVDLILVAAADPKAMVLRSREPRWPEKRSWRWTSRPTASLLPWRPTTREPVKYRCDYLASKIGGKGNVIIQNGPQVSCDHRACQRVQDCFGQTSGDHDLVRQSGWKGVARRRIERDDGLLDPLSGFPGPVHLLRIRRQSAPILRPSN